MDKTTKPCEWIGDPLCFHMRLGMWWIPLSTQGIYLLPLTFYNPLSLETCQIQPLGPWPSASAWDAPGFQLLNHGALRYRSIKSDKVQAGRIIVESHTDRVGRQSRWMGQTNFHHQGDRCLCPMRHQNKTKWNGFKIIFTSLRWQLSERPAACVQIDRAGIFSRAESRFTHTSGTCRCWWIIEVATCLERSADMPSGK